MTQELRVDRLYRNTNNWTSEDDEFNNFFRFSDGKGINNVSGFRPKSLANSKNTDIENCAFCVLITNLGETEWPDEINLETGLFTYYGDNRAPGSSIDSTPVGGNRLLQSLFHKVHSQRRELVPPLLCFEIVKNNMRSYMRFLGLAAPGAQGLSSVDDLVAVWKIKASQRFQNYRAIFTIFNEEKLSKEWLEDLVKGVNPSDSKHCPDSWAYWASTGIYRPLECKNDLQLRSKISQLPSGIEEKRVLNYLTEKLTDREFEYASLEIVRLLDPSFKELFVTRGVKDGGRDVIGKYYLGHSGHQIRLSAYIEAKKWKLESSVGVKPVMRLISRLKHRDIGVFVTTSFFDQQIQKELIEDGHPVMLISGGDISKLLIKADLSDTKALEAWISGIKFKAIEK